MSVDAVEELAGWPDNENTFLVSGPDGVRLAVTPADVGGELGMMPRSTGRTPGTGRRSPTRPNRSGVCAAGTDAAPQASPTGLATRKNSSACGRPSYSTAAAVPSTRSDWRSCGRLPRPRKADRGSQAVARLAYRLDLGASMRAPELNEALDA